MKKHSHFLKSFCFLLAAVMILSLAPAASAAEVSGQPTDDQIVVSEQQEDAAAQDLTAQDPEAEDTDADFGLYLEDLQDLAAEEDDEFDVIIEDMECEESDEDYSDEEYADEDFEDEGLTDEDFEEEEDVYEDLDEDLTDEALANEEYTEEEDSAEDALIEDQIAEETLAEQQAVEAYEKSIAEDGGKVFLNEDMLSSKIDALEKELSEEGAEYNGFIVTLAEGAENHAKGKTKTQSLEFVDDICVADSAEAILNDYDPADIVAIEPNYISYIPEDEYLSPAITEELAKELAEEKTEIAEEAAETAEESTVDSAYKPNDPDYRYGYQDNLKRINVPYAWKKGLSGSRLHGSKKVVVAVIDSGIYRYHEDFRSSHLLTGRDFTNTYGTYDYVGHGTACSSVIMATRNNNRGMTGVAPNVYVMPLKVFGYRGETDDATITNAINYAARQGVDVISMSLSGLYSTSAKQRACYYAAKKGIILVASAGNNGEGYNRYHITYPAGYSTVIGVGSVDSNNYVSSYSTVNSSSVFCTAQGRNIRVCGTSYSSSYRWMDGTSFSCPQVAAVAALVKSVDRYYSPAKFKKLLRKTCKDLGSYGKDPYYGYGLINMKKITNKLLPAKKIKINKKKLKLAAGKKYKLKAKIYPSNAADKRVKWKSSNPRVVRVSKHGKIKALRRGSATITVTSKANKKLKAKCKVTVLFKDVAKKSKYYYKPVYWAVKKKITSGVTRNYFRPSWTCTRKQFVIFLWRMAGRPRAYGTMKFRDVARKYGSSTDTYKAILWASNKGIIDGYRGNVFRPDRKLTRKQVVLMLYRYAGKPRVKGTVKFKDVRKYKKKGDTYKSILWAYKKGIVAGISKTKFGPKKGCTRANIVTFLYRYKH